MKPERATDAEILQDAGRAARRLAESLRELHADLTARAGGAVLLPSADAMAVGAAALLAAENAARRVASHLPHHPTVAPSIEPTTDP